MIIPALDMILNRGSTLPALASVLNLCVSIANCLGGSFVRTELSDWIRDFASLHSSSDDKSSWLVHKIMDLSVRTGSMCRFKAIQYINTQGTGSMCVCLCVCMRVCVCI